MDVLRDKGPGATYQFHSDIFQKMSGQPERQQPSAGVPQSVMAYATDMSRSLDSGQIRLCVDESGVALRIPTVAGVAVKASAK